MCVQEEIRDFACVKENKRKQVWQHLAIKALVKQSVCTR